MLSGDGTNALWCGWVSMPRSLEREPDGVAVALAIHLSVYCAVAACVALVMYYLMQPTRLPNPGMAAHKSSAITLNYLELLRSEREAAKRDVRLEAEPETTGAASQQSAEVKPETKKAKAQSTSQSRSRPARRPQRPVDTTHYAQQPFSGDYRPMY
jgi:low affinity Fe/Cu permease